jgi:hypothetical protein
MMCWTSSNLLLLPMLTKISPVAATNYPMSAWRSRGLSLGWVWVSRPFFVASIVCVRLRVPPFFMLPLCVWGYRCLPSLWLLLCVWGHGCFLSLGCHFCDGVWHLYFQIWICSHLYFQIWFCIRLWSHLYLQIWVCLLMEPLVFQIWVCICLWSHLYLQIWVCLLMEPPVFQDLSLFAYGATCISDLSLYLLMETLVFQIWGFSCDLFPCCAITVYWRVSYWGYLLLWLWIIVVYFGVLISMAKLSHSLLTEIKP